MPKRLATHSWSVRQALAAREPFRTYGALSAESGAWWQTGRLPEPYRTRYMDAWRDDAIVYTVRSYQTPIAWVLRTGEAIVPQVKYSRTTSGHQGLLYALDRPLADFADRAGAERQAQRDRAARRNEPAPTRVPWENDWPTGAQLGFPSTRQPAEPSASQPDDVLTRIRRALEEAEHSVPDTYFDGPASLLDAPDLAYSDR